MRFLPFTLFRLPTVCFLPLLWGGALPAEAPLMNDSRAVVDMSDSIALEWRIEAAERALDSGLPGLAETIYRALLDPAREYPPARMAQLRLGLARALLGQGRYEAARVQLEAVPIGSRTARHALYLALSIFAEGAVDADGSAFREAFKGVTAAELAPEDLPWFALAEGLLAELDSSPERATAAYQRAAKATNRPLLRSHFEGLVLRQKLLSAPADEALAAELRAKINQFEGQVAYPFVREYAVALYSLGRIGEAVAAIERELENNSAGYTVGEREQLSLLKGVILGADSESGRTALKKLILEGSNREAMAIALQLLARAPGQEDDLFQFLKDTIAKMKSHPLLGQMYYLRSQLALKNPGMREIAESDARFLLEQFPGLAEISSVYRLLAYASLEKDPPQYRAAADFLVQLRDQTTDPAELVELNRLIGDCYFLNRDYTNAVDFYSAARSRELGTVRSSELFLRLVLALLRSNEMEAALQLIDEADFSVSISLADRWRAEWNVAQTLHANGELDRALARVRLLLQATAPGNVPAALDFRLLWLEAKLSLELGQTEGLEARVAQMLARLDSLPDDIDDAPDALTPDVRRLLKTQILLLHGSVLIRMGQAEAGMAILTELRQSFGQTTAAQDSYMIEAAYHGLVGNFISAQTTLAKLAQTYPESPLAPQALFEAALYCERRGVEFYPQAVVLHNDLASRYPADPLYYHARLKQGNLLRSMNDFAGAQIVYENLINAYPGHEMRYLAELSRADCMLALAGSEAGALADVILVLERLRDLPNLPLDFQAEAFYKWAFALHKAEATDQAKHVLSQTIAHFLLDNGQATGLGASGRYWVARSMLMLGDLLEKEQALAEARRVYRKMIAYNLPGRHIAESRVDRLPPVE